MSTAESLLKKVRKIEFKTKLLSDHLFAGAYHSFFKGKGMVFDHIRNYQFGDDVRTIDWNVTAKWQEPYVKVFNEERELVLLLVIDISRSGIFGTRGHTKQELITEIAALFACAAHQNNDKTSLIFFSDRIEFFLPPGKGHNHLLRVIRELVSCTPISTQTNISVVLQHLIRLMQKRCIVCVLSDFQAIGYQAALAAAAGKHDLVGIRVYDQQEEELPDLGLIQLADAETGQTQWIDTSSATIRKQYQEWQHERKTYFDRAFAACGAGALSIRTDELYEEKLRQYFKNRLAYLNKR